MVSKSDELIERLRTYIEAGGRGTQAELARRLGVGTHRIHEWLTSDMRPGLEHGLQLQEILRRPARRLKRKEP